MTAQTAQRQAFSGWHLHTDGWYYWWDRDQVLGAWHPTKRVWASYDPTTGWGEHGAPPWANRTLVNRE